MIILCLKTDQPEAYLGLYKDHELLSEVTWEAHRELSNTIYQKIWSLLESQKLSLEQVDGFVCFKGPGSFTGLRIGLSAVNALVYAKNIKIVSTNGQSWAKDGVKRLIAGIDDKLVLPEYGAEANITTPKK
jgi:tRNA threonylcarbamoyladenosine biosynthesis protein TsaB